MKHRFIIIVLFSLVSLNYTFAQKTEKAIIKTSAECGQCKDRIEEKLNYTKGISFAELNYETQELTVKFKSDKISLQQIKEIVSNLGYDADDVKAISEEQQKLPACCQPGGMKK
jgi:periplasmic mercuric ion binding protein